MEDMVAVTAYLLSLGMWAISGKLRDVNSKNKVQWDK